MTVELDFALLKRIPSMLLYTIVRAKILVLSLIAPISILHIVFRISQLYSQKYTTFVQEFPEYFTLALEILAVCEVGFYFLFLRNLRRLQNLRPFAKACYTLTPEQRWSLFKRCMLTVDDIERFLSGWFFGTPVRELKRDNICDFLTWAFFSEDFEKLRKQATVEPETEESLLKKSELQEVYRMVNAFEYKFDLEVKTGRNPNAKCMRLNLDKMDPTHKPFVYYALLFLLEAVFTFLFRYLRGFRKYYSRGEQQLLLSYWDERPEFRSNKSRVSYWYRPAANPNPKHKPLVFIHGIGVGLFAYFTFFQKLWKELDGPVFVVEMPHVLTRFFPFYQPVIEDVPSNFETVMAIESMLMRHSIDVKKGATFVGHSLGTTVVTWMIKHRSQWVKRAIFLDPVCFLLHYPDVAYNFVYRKPIDTASWLIHFFCGRELYVSWTLYRCFYWFACALFPSEIPVDCETSIVFGGRDYIIPGYEILEKLKEFGGVEVTVKEELPRAAEKALRLYFYPDLNHAEFLFRPQVESDIVKIIAGHKLADKEIADSAYVSRRNSIVAEQDAFDDMLVKANVEGFQRRNSVGGSPYVTRKYFPPSPEVSKRRSTKEH